MRKFRILIVLSVFVALVLLATGLFACKKPQVVDPNEGRVVAVATAMDTVYAAMLASDGSAGANFFTLNASGSYEEGEEIYDFTFGGTFDITQNNRDEDKRSQLLLEVKKGSAEVFLLYYSEGKLYVDFPPYARRGVISDFNLAEVVHELYGQKESGVVKTVADSLPLIASRIFASCHCFSTEEGDRYVFALSYPRLFDAFNAIVDSWEAGFGSAELLAALHLDEEKAESLMESAPETNVEFLLKDGALLSAKATVKDKGAFKLDSFSLTRGSDEIALPSALSSFTEFDLRNFSLSGTMVLQASGQGDSEVNYDVVFTKDYDNVSYSFDYDFKSHYVAGQGLEFSLALTDKNGKHSAFNVRGDYLYVDLTEYGVAKCKIATDTLSSRLGVTGFKDVGEFDFRDKLHMLVLLAAGRSESQDVVSYTLGKEFFELLSEKIGFKGLFGVDGAEVSWSKANNRLQNLSASFNVAGMTASLSAPTFTFGTPVELPAVDTASYADLADKQTTHIAVSGTIRQNTVFETDGALLSALLSSLAGEDIEFTESSSTQYTADIVFAADGSVKNFFARLYNARGSEIVNVYYTDETPDDFYLISPEQAGSGVRTVRTFALAEEPLAGFNAALGAADSNVGRNVLFGAYENTFMFGVHSPMLSVIAEKIALVYPGFSLDTLSSLKCRRYETRVTDSTITTKIVFDDDNDIQITATSFAVTFNDNRMIESLTAATPETVAILADNDMPDVATAVFTGGLTYRVSLKDNVTDEKIWNYRNVPTRMGRAGQIESVEATASILGKTIQATVKADLSPATEVELANSVTYADRYDAGTRTFTMQYYNDATPKNILDSFSFLIASVDNTEYPKEIEWDLTGVSTSLGRKEFTVKPKVKTYFGNEIYLGDVALFTLSIEGEKAVSTAYTKTFVAYDGMDPMDPAVYSEVLVVTTSDGQTVEVRHVEWDLTNAFIESKIRNNLLYAYTTDPTQPDIMRARVYDSTGAYVVLEIPVFFEARVVNTADFDVSGLSGVTYDEGTGFTFDVLKVRSLLPNKTVGILPQAFVANAGEADEWQVSGVKWSFDAIENVLNASGATGVLTLTIGDSISGYQEKDYPYAFTSVTVTGTALLTSDKQPVASIARTGASLFEYAAMHLNAYTYTFPAYVRVDFTVGGNAESEDLLVAWTYDKPFNETALCDGGAYVLTGAVGSETLTVSLSFDRQLITSYRFADEATMISSGALTTHQGKLCLTFSALAALTENGAKYTSKDNYPTSLEIAFNGDSTYVPASVTWDLSAYDGREDMIGSGFLGVVKATAKGQNFDVYVYVAPAYDSVYTDAGLTKSDLTFRLMSAGELAQDGMHYKLVVTDPRSVENYPTVLYVGAGQTVEVIEWLGIDAVARLYSESYETTAPNAVSGNVVVRAKIGNAEVGYKEIQIPVHIVDSVIDEDEIEVSGLPFAASSEMTGGSTPYAVTPNYAPLQVNGVDCRFSLDANPYYVNPKEQRTYPAYLDFELDGRAVRAEAKWDLDAIPENAAMATESQNYVAWAMIDLGSSFKKVKIPVAVTVLKREIDVVWIKDSEGNYTNEKYLDIDGYALDPFGDDVVGDEVSLDVKVQFKKDANRYPLKLKYSKQGVVLSYDGSNVYENVSVRVGNESGGYRTIDGYTIRILSNIVSKIRVWNSGVCETFFEAVYDAGTGNMTYNYYSAVDMGGPLPTEIKATFGQGGAEVTVPIATENNAGKGLVFSWDRSKDGNHYLGVVLWNPSVSAEVGGARQAIYNSKQKNFAEPRVDMFFDGSFTDSAVYRDSVDTLGPITVSGFLADRDEEILTAQIAKTYQNRYITVDVDNAARLNATDVLTVGTYRLYVSVEGHEQYEGEVYKTFTVTPKDVSATVTLYVNGARRTENDPKEQYTGTAFQVRAKANYGIDVPFLVDGLSAQNVTDVHYVAGNVAAYEFTVTVDVTDQIGRNYKVENATVAFKITEAPLPDGAADIRLTWAATRQEFDVTVKVFGNAVSNDPTLTNGYKIYYYETNSSLDEVTTFTAGTTYYYTIEIKVPNYMEVDRIRRPITAA